MIKRLLWIIKKKIVFVIDRTIIYFCWLFPIDNKKVFCTYFDGKGYSDSPKYIVEELLKRNNKKIIWALGKNISNNLPKDVMTVKVGSLKYLYHLATAKIIINSNRFSVNVTKRKKQYYIQTWHGSLMLKKIEYDVYDKLDKEYKKMMVHDNKLIDAIISNSKFTSDIYRNAFKINCDIFEYGIPRNDVLINNQEKLKEKVYKYFNLKKDTKLLLYAPTFRDDYTNNPYAIDFTKVKKTLENTTNCKWKIMIKFHPLVKNPQKLISNNFEYIDANQYSDTQELLCSSDLLITDYSSLMFDALIAKKITLLFANDIDTYLDERGFYFNLTKLPFPLAKNNEELINILNDIDNKKIFLNYDKFSKKLGIVDDGKASARVADLSENQMGKRIL